MPSNGADSTENVPQWVEWWDRAKLGLAVAAIGFLGICLTVLLLFAPVISVELAFGVMHYFGHEPSITKTHGIALNYVLLVAVAGYVALEFRASQYRNGGGVHE